MISNYYCSHCDYDAKQKSDYDKHLKTKRHQKLAEISHKSEKEIQTYE